MERLKQAEFARMSWCEADIFAMHGDVFPRTGLMQDWQEEDDSVPVIYPDLDPRGALQPSATTPTGTTLESLLVPNLESNEYSSELPAPTANPITEKPPTEKPSAGLLRLPRTIKPSR
jgi:hypothetical protein